MADLTKLQQNLSLRLKDQSILQQALVHSSYVNENPGLASGSNERLEFLGDAILGLIISKQLYQDFPSLAEGELTRLRAVLVRRDTLAQIARTIALGDYLFIGKGEEASGGRLKPANLAGALEAVIGAVFLDQGLAAAKKLVLKLFRDELQKIASQGAEVDYKSKLQELVQAKRQIAPTYHVIEEMGPDHAKEFTVEVRIGGTVLGRGSGKSKKLAETEAARSALQRLSTNFTA